MRLGLRLALIRDIVAREVYTSQPKAGPRRGASAGGCSIRSDASRRLQRLPVSQERVIATGRPWVETRRPGGGRKRGPPEMPVHSSVVLVATKCCGHRVFSGDIQPILESVVAIAA